MTPKQMKSNQWNRRYEFFKFKVKNSMKKNKAPTMGIWLRKTKAKSKVKADHDVVRNGYSK